MDQNLKNREEKIYTDLINLKTGNDSDRSLAFECLGILGNESINESYDNRMKIVEEMIERHRKS